MDVTRKRQEVVGRVVSDKMEKTRVIEIEQALNHHLYHKKVRRHVRLLVHDKNNESQKGDLIKAISSRPLSKHKHFRMTKVVEKGLLK